MRFVDCNCMVGMPIAAHEFMVCDPGEIERISRNCGVMTVFAHHAATFDLHPIDGNLAIDAVCAKNSFFRPVWVVMPNDTGEFFDPHALAQRMRQQNIRIVRMYPRYNDHGFSMAQWSAGPLLSVLAELGVPLLLDADQLDWGDVHSVMTENPKLSVILTNIYYRQGRVVVSLLKQHKNLYCETSGLRSFCLLQTFCESAGAGQLVFGTGMGVYSAGSAIALVTYAGISLKEKEAIAYGNLCRVLGTDVDSI